MPWWGSSSVVLHSWWDACSYSCGTMTDTKYNIYYVYLFLWCSDGDDQAECCPICFRKLKTQELGTPEACDHTFCVLCLKEWAKNTCPVDRQRFSLIPVRRSLGGKIIGQIPVENVEPPQGNAIDDDPTYCEICGECDREDRMMLCDGCDLGFHLECLTTPLHTIPIAEWYCPSCSVMGALGDHIEEVVADSDEEFGDYLPRRRLRNSARRVHHLRPDPSHELSESDDDWNLAARSSIRHLQRLIPRTRQSQRIIALVNSNNFQSLVNDVDFNEDDSEEETNSAVTTTQKGNQKKTGTPSSRRKPRQKRRRKRKNCRFKIKLITTEEGVIEVKLPRKRKKRYRKRKLNYHVTDEHHVIQRSPDTSTRCSDEDDLSIGGSSEIGQVLTQRNHRTTISSNLRTMSRKKAVALLSRSQLQARSGTAKKRPVDKPATSTKPAGSSLLDSILDSQTKWHSKNAEIIHNHTDGSVSVKVTEKRVNVNKENGNCKTTKTPLYPGSSNPHGSRFSSYDYQSRDRNISSGRPTDMHSSNPSSSFPSSNLSSFSSNRAGFTSNYGIGISPFTGAAPIRFRMNLPPRRPNIHTNPVVPPLRQPPFPDPQLFTQEPSPSNSPNEEEEVDIYSDIEPERTTDNDGEEGGEKSYGTLEPPPEPPALLMGLGQDDIDEEHDEGGLVIDDQPLPPQQPPLIPPPPAEEYDPAEPCEDSNSSDGFDEKSHPNYGMYPTVGPLPDSMLSSKPIHSDRDDDDDDDDEDEDEDENDADCPNFSMYSAASMNIAHKNDEMQLKKLKINDDEEEEDISLPSVDEKYKNNDEMIDVPLPPEDVNDKKDIDEVKETEKLSKHKVSDEDLDDDGDYDDDDDDDDADADCNKDKNEKDEMDDSKDSNENEGNANDSRIKDDTENTSDIPIPEDLKEEDIPIPADINNENIPIPENNDNNEKDVDIDINEEKENDTGNVKNKKDNENVNDNSVDFKSSVSVDKLEQMKFKNVVRSNGNKDIDGEDECSTQDVLDLAIGSEGNLQDNLANDENEEPSISIHMENPEELEEGIDKMPDAGEKPDGLVDITDEEMSVYDGQDNSDNLEKLSDNDKENELNDSQKDIDMFDSDDNSLVGGATSAVSAGTLNNSDNQPISTLPGLEGLETETISESEDVNFDELPDGIQNEEQGIQNEEYSSSKRKKKKKTRKTASMSETEDANGKCQLDTLEFEEGEIIEDKPKQSSKKDKKSKEKHEKDVDKEEAAVPHAVTATTQVNKEVAVVADKKQKKKKEKKDSLKDKSAVGNSTNKSKDSKIKEKTVKTIKIQRREGHESLVDVGHKNTRKNLTVIVTNKDAVRKKDKKKTTKKKDDKRKRRRGQSPAPSKEVFTSGDNILVSVNFKSNRGTAEIVPATTPVLRESSKRKRDDVDPVSGKRKKDKSSKENVLVRNKSAQKGLVNKSTRLTKLNEAMKNAKPVAIIDLDMSLFREQTPSPKEVIILSDSGEENDKQQKEMEKQLERLGEGMSSSRLSLDTDHQQNTSVSQPESPSTHSFMMTSTVPKTPPEPHVKFSIVSNKPQLRVLANPLMECDEELRRDEATETDMDEVMHKGPNTPPEPPPDLNTPASPPTTPYDPFDPTKSRSPSPQPPSDSGLQVNSSREDKSVESSSNLQGEIMNDGHGTRILEHRTLTPPVDSDELKKTPEPLKVLSTPKLDQSGVEVSPKHQSPASVGVEPTKSADDSLLKPFQKLLSTANKIDVPVHKSPDKLILTVGNMVQQQINKINQTPSKQLGVIKKPANLVPVYTPSMTLNSSKSIRTQENGATGDQVDDVLDLDAGSPYSPGSSEGDDLFDPPPMTPPRPSKQQPPLSSASKPSQPKTTAVAPSTQNKFDLLFSSSPMKLPARHGKHHSGKANKKGGAKGKGKAGTGRKEVGVKLDEDQLKILDELPSSAVEMQVKDKFLKKLNRQERVVEEVKLVLKPHYAKKHITKEDYKEILRRAVPKICHNKSGEINPMKIQCLIEAYVKKFLKIGAGKKKPAAVTQNAVPASKPKVQKTMWS
ncbi:uncharacterized protein LOC142328390 [Lycorma delicatula]|uniref:uncharacterized protein LOC142328390 n=1 Tax=Lycorma delicatula TaxID=130591 RepID=UPI003F5166CF